MSKITKVVFVGDQPSATNTVDGIAFVGAACFSRLVDWINAIDADFYICLNSNELTYMGDIHKLVENADFKVIALGIKAASRLQEFDIDHFMLPHPSGLNRQINDPIAIKTLLMEAQEYVHE